MTLRVCAGRVVRLGAVICVCAAAGCAQQAPAADRQTSGPDAPRLYAIACSKCHGADGRGGLPMVANGPRPIDLHDATWQASRSDTEIVAAIRNGRGAMPPFSDVLKPEDITALAGYVRTFRASGGVVPHGTR